MGKYDKGVRIIRYVAPCVSLFSSRFALAFGTRHGIPKFVEEILSLYRGGYFTDLIISGGITGHDAKVEASVLYEALLSCGVPERAMIVEDKAMNTGQNVAFTREIVRDVAIKELVLIGKIASKRRYLMTVRKQWPEITSICCHGINYFSCPAEQWWKDQEFRRRVISEYRKIPLSAAFGGVRMPAEATQLGVRLVPYLLKRVVPLSVKLFLVVRFQIQELDNRIPLLFVFVCHDI